MLRAEINRLTQMNDEHSLKSKQFEREIDELKEKNEFLEKTEENIFLNFNNYFS